MAEIQTPPAPRLRFSATHRFEQARCADPLGVLAGVYRTLGLDGFAAAAPQVRAYLDAISGYRKTRYTFAPERVDAVAERWRPFIDGLGYPSPAVGRAAP